MTIDTTTPSALSDGELLREVKTLACRERSATAQLIASLAELDARKLYLGEGYSSLFTYCTQVLHPSEHAAYGRIEAARLSRRFPMILDMLSDGAVTLTTIGLLAPLLTSENHRELLTAARHKSKRDVEFIVASQRPQVAGPFSIRRLPQPLDAPLPDRDGPMQTDRGSDNVGQPVGCSPPPLPAPVRPASVVPLTPERYKIQMTVTRDTHQKLQQVQDLLRHQVPTGDPAVILDRALTALLDQIRRTKCGEATRPRVSKVETTRSRHIPAAVRRAVWARDEGRKHSSAPTGGARNADSSNTTTWCHSPTEERPLLKTCSYAVARTMPSKTRNGMDGRSVGSCARSARRL